MTEEFDNFLRASETGDTDTVRRILDLNKSLLNMQDEDGESALMCASYFGHPEIVKILIENGAKRELIDVHGYSALTYAVENQNIKIIRLLT